MGTGLTDLKMSFSGNIPEFSINFPTLTMEVANMSNCENSR